MLQCARDREVTTVAAEVRASCGDAQRASTTGSAAEARQLGESRWGGAVEGDGMTSNDGDALHTRPKRTGVDLGNG